MTKVDEPKSTQVHAPYQTLQVTITCRDFSRSGLRLRHEPRKEDVHLDRREGSKDYVHCLPGVRNSQCYLWCLGHGGFYQEVGQCPGRGEEGSESRGGRQEVGLCIPLSQGQGDETCVSTPVCLSLSDVSENGREGTKTRGRKRCYDFANRLYFARHFTPQSSSFVNLSLILVIYNNDVLFTQIEQKLLKSEFFTVQVGTLLCTTME